MTDWIIPCNLKYYDVASAFKKLQRINWKQTMKSVETGDLVYIYVGNPVKAIMYKCCVTKVNLSSIEIDDSAFVVNGEPYINYGRHMELELLKTYDNQQLCRSVLIEHGLKGNIQGPRRMDDEIKMLIAKIEK